MKAPENAAIGRVTIEAVPGTSVILAGSSASGKDDLTSMASKVSYILIIYWSEAIWREVNARINDENVIFTLLPSRMNSCCLSCRWK